MLVVVEAGGATALFSTEAKAIPNETIVTRHDDSKEYIIQLDVFHQLHCLVRLLLIFSPKTTAVPETG